ncbi:MAG: alpha/beta hydrolase [Bacteroidetes bacterium]|nr:alpha/beta hydrolase [Bacteroidota bacterium]
MAIIKRFFKWLFLIVISAFCVLSILPYVFSNHLKDAQVKPFENSSFFEFNHTKFHYRLFVPKHIRHKVLLIHGFSGSTFSFRNTIDSLLNHDILVIAMDMPAFGYSDKRPDADYSDTTKIKAIHFLLHKVDELTNHKKWHLTGHSMGGIVIGQFASSYPQQTQSLIFIDGLPFSQSHSITQKLAVYPPLLKWADILLERQFLNQSSFQELLSSAYSQPADSISVDGYLQPFQTKYSGSAIFQMFAGSGYVQTNDSILNGIPKLIIWGKQDAPWKHSLLRLTLPLLILLVL